MNQYYVNSIDTVGLAVDGRRIGFLWIAHKILAICISEGIKSDDTLMDLQGL